MKSIASITFVLAALVFGQAEDSLEISGSENLSVVEAILQQAESYLGVPYVWGGADENGFDCSGLTYRVFNDNGIALPRTVSAIEEMGVEVDRDSMLPGDEYLIYDNFILFYTSPGERISIAVHPEELWTILSHCNRSPLPSTSQTSLEAWYPGLEEPVTSFVTHTDPAMAVITELFARGRETVQ